MASFTVLRHKKAGKKGFVKRPYVRVCNNGHSPNIYLIRTSVPSLYASTDTMHKLLRSYNSTGKLLHETRASLLADYELVSVDLCFPGGEQSTQYLGISDGIV